MPSLSKARLITDHRSPAEEVSAFVYRGVQIPGSSDGALMTDLPPGTEMLWAENVTGGEPIQEETAAAKYSDEKVQALEQQAWQKGFDEAAAQSRENLEKSIALERSNVAAALAEFADGRQAYYQRIEGEVVRLVLSIARKVLHREAQVDPMLLAGVVMVALEKIAGGTSVKLRVPVDQVVSWKGAISSLPAKDLVISVEGDGSLSGPHCVIVSDLGTTDVSLDAQLDEIEHGFLDLLAEHPQGGKTRNADNAQ